MLYFSLGSVETSLRFLLIFVTLLVRFTLFLSWRSLSPGQKVTGNHFKVLSSVGKPVWENCLRGFPLIVERFSLTFYLWDFIPVVIRTRGKGKPSNDNCFSNNCLVATLGVDFLSFPFVSAWQKVGRDLCYGTKNSKNKKIKQTGVPTFPYSKTSNTL